MRLRDHPMIEVTRAVSCSPERAWEIVTDITLPTAVDGELQSVAWQDDADAVALGARFTGENQNEQFGTWTTVSEVVDLEPGRRWVWSVGPGHGDAWAYWGFEVDPSRQGALVRQWGRLGDGESAFAAFAAAQPEKEGRIIDYRLGIWRAGMEANLDEVARRAEA